MTTTTATVVAERRTLTYPSMVTNLDGRCGSCAAFVRVRPDAQHGQVGECALEVFTPPVLQSNACSRYRPKGALGAAPKPRAAGEPRRRGEPRASRPRSSEPQVYKRPLPRDIDIDMDIDDFRRVLREVLREEIGGDGAELGRRWQGGEVVLRPGNADTQEKSIPLDSFFHKIVMVRDKLRVLEAKVNGNKALSDGDKVQLQSYITACYGSLTTFNVLFADKSDQFTTKR